MEARKIMLDKTRLREESSKRKSETDKEISVKMFLHLGTSDLASKQIRKSHFSVLKNSGKKGYRYVYICSRYTLNFIQKYIIFPSTQKKTKFQTE